MILWHGVIMAGPSIAQSDQHLAQLRALLDEQEPSYAL
jgi:hypothetical protein